MLRPWAVLESLQDIHKADHFENSSIREAGLSLKIFDLKSAANPTEYHLARQIAALFPIQTNICERKACSKRYL